MDTGNKHTNIQSGNLKITGWNNNKTSFFYYKISNYTMIMMNCKTTVTESQEYIPVLLAGQCRRPRFYPWGRKIPWKREWQLTPVFLAGESHRRRSLAGYSPCSCRVGHDWVTNRRHKLSWTFWRAIWQKVWKEWKATETYSMCLEIRNN